MSKFPSKTDLSFIKSFDDFASQYVNQHLTGDFGTAKEIFDQTTSASHLLTESMLYTLLAKTKRFRPLLIIYTAQALNLDYKKVLPWALSVEMIHNFSLIHDDLPCMDNDDYRREKLSNHKVFGEALALLSGNSLLTEAFSVLVHYFNSPSLCVSLVKEVTQAVGARAMMLGQVGDLVLDKKIEQSSELSNSYQMSKQMCNEFKTGALIKSSVLGVFYIYEEQFSSKALLDKDIKNQLTQFSFYLGRAFQWADDLVDAEGDKTIVANKLKEDSQQALTYIKNLPGDTKPLEHLIMANQAHFK